MSWFEMKDLSLVFYAVIFTLGVLAIALLGFTWWTTHIERRRVRRYVESRGGEVLSLDRVGTFRPASPYSMGDFDDHLIPWHDEPDTPTYRVRWRTPNGTETTGEFKTRYFRRSVWSATPDRSPTGARTETGLLRAEGEPRQPDDVPGDTRVRW